MEKYTMSDNQTESLITFHTVCIAFAIIPVLSHYRSIKTETLYIVILGRRPEDPVNHQIVEFKSGLKKAGTTSPITIRFAEPLWILGSVAEDDDLGGRINPDSNGSVAEDDDRGGRI